MKNDKETDILYRCAKSILQGFKRFLRTEVVLVEDDIRLVLDKNSLNFITDEISPVNYAFNDRFKVPLSKMKFAFEGSNQWIELEFHDISMKTKTVVASGILAKRFDEKSFFSTILGFYPDWDYKHYIQYISRKL